MSKRKVPNERTHISVGPNDVILGRGNHLSNAGNEKFLDVVRSRSIEYWSCTDNTDKDTIARQVVDTVKSLGGRFLRSNTDKVRSIDLSIKGTSTVVQWEIASNHVVLTKVKQSFRDLTASVKKRNASSKVNRNSTDLPSLPIDHHSYQVKLSKVFSPVSSNENAAVLMTTSQSHQNTNESTSQISMTLPVDSTNLQQTFSDHSSSEKEHTDHTNGGDPTCKSTPEMSMNRNDPGMMLSAPHSNHDRINEFISQSCIKERNSDRVDVAAPCQPPNDSLIESAIVSQSDLIHRNIVDQQMLAVMREQQSRFPKALQLAAAKNRGTTGAHQMNINCNYNMAQSLIRAELLQQQQHRSVQLQHHLNLGAFCQQQLHSYPNQSYQVPVALLPTVPSIEPQQSSTLDAMLSQLSPLELANIQSALLANQSVSSLYNASQIASGLAVSTNTYTQLPNFDLNGGKSDNITSVDMLRELQLEHLRNNDTIIDAIHKSDSDADSNEDQKPPGRL